MTSGKDAAGAGPGEALVEKGFRGDSGREWHGYRGPEASCEMTDIASHEDEGIRDGAGKTANMTHRVLRSSN